jgi:NTP pyrophosphatase (non-canonical NTP hydrolase)
VAKRKKIFEETCNACLTKFGQSVQLDQAMEEAGELVTAIAKFKRYGSNAITRANLIDEIADVQIQLHQLAQILDGAADIEHRLWIKLNGVRHKVGLPPVEVRELKESGCCSAPVLEGIKPKSTLGQALVNEETKMLEKMWEDFKNPPFPGVPAGWPDSAYERYLGNFNLQPIWLGDPKPDPYATAATEAVFKNPDIDGRAPLSFTEFCKGRAGVRPGINGAALIEVSKLDDIKWEFDQYLKNFNKQDNEPTQEQGSQEGTEGNI